MSSVRKYFKNTIILKFYILVVRTKEPQYGKPPPDQGGQFPLYWNPSNLTSQQIQHLTANELQKNDQYWQQRIKNLEEKHKKMNQVMEDEYVKAVSMLPLIPYTIINVLDFFININVIDNKV